MMFTEFRRRVILEMFLGQQNEYVYKSTYARVHTELKKALDIYLRWKL
jgi:hypothetical protein